MSELSDEELAQAAAEAGISSEELKHALARRNSGEALEPETIRTKAKSHGFVQAQLPGPLSPNLARVHRIFSEQVELIPSQGADGQTSYALRESGMIYHVGGGPDPASTGSVVRVDIDLSVRDKRVLKASFPAMALLALIAGILALDAIIAIGLMCIPTFLISWKIGKHRNLREAKKTAEAVLDRASQGVLPGRSL